MTKLLKFSSFFRRNKKYLGGQRTASPIEHLSENINPTAKFVTLAPLISIVLRVLASVPKLEFSTSLKMEHISEFGVNSLLELEDSILSNKKFYETAKLLEDYKKLFIKGKQADKDPLANPKTHLDIYSEAHQTALKIIDILPERYHWLGIIAACEALSHRSSSAYYHYSKKKIMVIIMVI